MKNVAMGVFSSNRELGEVISALESGGYSLEDMFIMVKDQNHIDNVSKRTGAENVIGNTFGGAATGVILGGLAGLAASLVIPGLGTFLIGGPTASALGLTGAAAATASGAATGALAGGVIGALVSIFGLSEDDARIYEGRLNEGGILLAIPLKVGNEKQVKELLERHNADNIRVVVLPEKEFIREKAAYIRPAVHFSEIRKSPGRKRTGKSSDMGRGERN